MDKFLDIAKRRVRTHNFNPNLVSYHCAMIVRGGKILSVGFNRSGSSKVQHSKSHKHCSSVHAEVSALLNLQNREDAIGSKIYVVRINKNGQYAISVPCQMCQVILIEKGLKKAIFTLDNSENTYGVMKF